jgi:hypothetical protein
MFITDFWWCPDLNTSNVVISQKNYELVWIRKHIITSLVIRYRGTLSKYKANDIKRSKCIPCSKALQLMLNGSLKSIRVK